MSYADNCAHCGNALPNRGTRRVAVPRLGGKKRRVHAECAAEIEKQGTLAIEVRR